MKRKIFLCQQTYFSALSKKECLKDGKGEKKAEARGGISMPTKLTQLRYSGYSAEFLDRVEPNGNIPVKSGNIISGID